MTAAWPGSVFTQKQVFGPRTAKSQPIWIKFSTHLIVVRNTLLGRLRPRSASGRLQAKLERLCVSVILVTHPKSYNYREDGSPRFRRQTVKVEMIPELCSVGEARSKNSILRVFRVPFDYLCTAYKKQFYPKSMAPMESRASEGVPYASL